SIDARRAQADRARRARMAAGDRDPGALPGAGERTHVSWWARLRATLRSAARERELAEELESHLQLDVDERVRRGATPEEARRQALLALGGVEATKERVRDQSRLRRLESVAQDLRFALRTLRKERLFTAARGLPPAAPRGAH